MTRPSKRRGSGPRVIASAEIQPRRRSARPVSVWGPRHTYAICRPSGDHTGDALTPGIWNASPAAGPVRRNQVVVVLSVPPSRRLVKLSSAPSGDHTGLAASVPGLVNRYGGAEPSVGAIHTSLWRRSLSSTTVVTVNATSRPVGARAGAETPLSL